ncbi:hypothetical protein LZ554_005398 [Drepanopeziza brunnea f. sp. 'monogermtubi']|nr:hypothetical protein LZ554_005398 [Drepanopeziza brunnea f. sp. 'monogermtubi']
MPSVLNCVSIGDKKDKDKDKDKDKGRAYRGGIQSRVAFNINTIPPPLLIHLWLICISSTFYAMDGSSPGIPSHPTPLPTTLLQLLSNTLVLDQTAPYLPLPARLSLGATSKSFRDLISDSPVVFRHLDLTKLRSARFEESAAIDHGGQVWRNVRLDENVTEDDFYGAPLQAIFRTLGRRNILQNVHTLILDGLSVTHKLLAEIIIQDCWNVRTLSIREVQNLNERKLQQALIYAVRPSRAANPKLQALYIFGGKDNPLNIHISQSPGNHVRLEPSDAWSSDGGVLNVPGAQLGAHWNMKSGQTLAEELASSADKWYQTGGKVFSKPISLEWANTLYACQGIISFDAALCHGPRHSPGTKEHSQVNPWYRSESAHLSSRVATHSIGCCSNCGEAPEGISSFGVSPLDRFPLLSPPPLHSSTAKAAKTPFSHSGDKLLLRCMDCLRNRFCESCKRWWCEDCYEVPNGNMPGSAQSRDTAGPASRPDQTSLKAGVVRSCFECGLNCHQCIQLTQLTCKICGGGYCTIHNEGSTLTTCDWCARSGRRTREMY